MQLINICMNNSVFAVFNNLTSFCYWLSKLESDCNKKGWPIIINSQKKILCLRTLHCAFFMPVVLNILVPGLSNISQLRDISLSLCNVSFYKLLLLVIFFNLWIQYIPCNLCLYSLFILDNSSQISNPVCENKSNYRFINVSM